MTEQDANENILRTILPYSRIVGQEKLKLALELAYIAPRIGGVLLSGKRGTAKSTTVRAFSNMMYDALPVTIPINATEDRVVGGWKIKELLDGEPVKQEGLLKEADKKLLYIDEVNLLDDHIVNIILDVTSTGKLIVQREGRNDHYDVQTTLVGTMNPEEGGLRPQLLDRFGLMVGVEEETRFAQRLQILETVLAFDLALQQEQNTPQDSAFRKQAELENARIKRELEDAKERFYTVKLEKSVAEACVRLAEQFKVEGHRSDYLLALTACAYAARIGKAQATFDHLSQVADLVLRHRLPGASQVDYAQWNAEYDQRVSELLAHV